MATSRQPWSVPGVILFSHGEFSYEVDLSRPLVEELAQSRLGEIIVPAWERTEKKRLREVIVRSLPPTSSDDPEMLERMRARLREEAHLATYLQHPRIARTLGPYEVQGVLYIVSDRVEGTSINSLITYSQMREKLLSPAFCLYVGAEVAGALHYAHTCKDENGAPLGIVHRDLNPARIFLEPEGGVILTDFARARSLLPGRVASTLPRPHGDVFYCSPEALLCEETDPLSDLFSLGLVLLELATWRHLYSMPHLRPSDLEKALTPKAKKQVLDAAITAMEAELPEHTEDCILRAATFTRQDVDSLTEPLAHPLRSIVRRLIQRNPGDRYQSAADVEADLRAGLAALGASYGATEALDEVLFSLEGASMNQRVIGPTNEGQLPPDMVTEEDIITERGGTT
ncbi:serine/threonine protein kinase [Hyalangium rubrum]|uniref:non-specific serine/threonine protein kinase n=1 Tax=Hyalangium rubrum TaxID=3103134 RepID=A0ABU5HIX4_9BACT|nr:protein kinase [Hyalangium sp. s54d21]MDY7233321.1 protein kinase [Hyalangium sp. s54d21]